jgi:glycosyltransferase involved in cell wall biosynthesis
MSPQEEIVSHPEVTVVITTRDRPALVVGAVGSALAQTVRSIEVVVVDDASASPLGLPLADGRLRLLRADRPGGVCAARNRGLAAARGRWVTFLDDDDRLLPDMLQTSLEAAGASGLPPPVAVMSGIQEVDDRGRPGRTLLPATLARGGHYTLEDGLPGDLPTHNSLVVPTSVARSAGGWDESLPAWEHLDFFLRLNAVCSIQGVDRVAYRRRAHQSGRLSDNLPARIDGIRRTLDKHQAVFALHPRGHAHYLGAIGIAWLRLGRWGPAVAATSRALRVAPGRPRAVAQWLASLAGPRVWAAVDPERARFRRTLKADGVPAA